jgi:hypothetical protein
MEHLALLSISTMGLPPASRVWIWSGSGWQVGAPRRLNSNPILGFPTYDTAKMFTVGLLQSSEAAGENRRAWPDPALLAYFRMARSLKQMNVF